MAKSVLNEMLHWKSVRIYFVSDKYYYEINPLWVKGYRTIMHVTIL